MYDTYLLQSLCVRLSPKDGKVRSRKGDIHRKKQNRKPCIRFDRYDPFCGGTKWEGLGSLAWMRFDMAYIGLWSCMIKHSSQRTSRFILIFFLHRNAFSSMSTMIPPHNVLLHVLVCTTSSCLLFRISSSNGTWGKKENTFFSKCLNILSTRPRGKNKPRSIYQ